MWLLTTEGFYSVTEEPGTDRLQVRARVKADLDRLRKNHLPTLSPTAELGRTRDYEFRAYCSKQEWADALPSIAATIDYLNFKDAVTRKQGVQRHDVYAGVWRALLGLERLSGRFRRERKQERGRQRVKPLDVWYDELLAKGGVADVQAKGCCGWTGPGHFGDCGLFELVIGDDEEDTEKEPCHVANDDCEAPAGYRCGGLGGGIYDNTEEAAAEFRCFGCDQPVCAPCSQVIPWFNHGEQRICDNCVEETVQILEAV